jgi:hypothetical protein
MRLHVVLLGLAVAGFAGWLAFGSREQHPDLVRGRDALVASDSLVVAFDPGGVGGYRFTSVKGAGWLWERTDAKGEPYADALLYNGVEHLLRIGDSCYVRLAEVRMPVIPGVTVALRLARQPDVEERGEQYVYSVAAGFAVRPEYRHGLPDLEVTEDLSRLRTHGIVTATTGRGTGYVWPGDYTIARATAPEVARVREVLGTARASDYAEVILRERVFGSVVGGGASEPASVVIARDCPGQPVRLGAGAYGGQAEALRTIPAPYGLTYGENPVFRDATTTGASVAGPVEYLNRAFQGGTFGHVSVRTTETILVRLAPSSGVGLQIISCTSRPWFQC